MMLPVLFTEMSCCYSLCCKPLKRRSNQGLPKHNCFAVSALKSRKYLKKLDFKFFKYDIFFVLFYLDYSAHL